MGSDYVGMDQIMETMREPIKLYATQVEALAGDNALSLTLFGTIAAGTFERQRHVVRSVLVLDRIDLEMLRKLASSGPKLGKARISAPLIMTPQYIRESLDTFPLELLEIGQLHLTLFGDDYFEGLSFNISHVRLQCERELKSILIGMRQGLLAFGGKEKLIGAMEMDIAERLIRTFRGLLWLNDQKDGYPYPRVVSEVEKLIQGDLPGVRAAVDPSGHHGWEEFQSLYKDIETVGHFVETK